MFGLGKFTARLAKSEQDIRRCQQLRWLSFRASEVQGERIHDGLDADEFDARCWHMMVECGRSGQLVCTFRMQEFDNGMSIGRSYAAKYYELSALMDYPGRMLEMGRFCIHPEWRDPNILRVAWGAMKGFVDRRKVELLFGCSSFSGVDDGIY
ncbi:MAG: GNAT family N-acetyltransferase, partial [Pseudomonadota bacterium]